MKTFSLHFLSFCCPQHSQTAEKGQPAAFLPNFTNTNFSYSNSLNYYFMVMASPVLRWSLEYVKVGSKPLSLFFLFFPNIISLLIIWNVIQCTLFILTSHSSQVHLSFPCILHPKEKEKKKKQLSSLCVAHTLIGTWVNFLVASSLKITARSHQLWSYTGAFLSQCWRRLVTSCLDCHRSRQCLSFSIMSL